MNKYENKAIAYDKGVDPSLKYQKLSQRACINKDEIHEILNLPDDFLTDNKNYSKIYESDYNPYITEKVKIS